MVAFASTATWASRGFYFMFPPLHSHRGYNIPCLSAHMSWTSGPPVPVMNRRRMHVDPIAHWHCRDGRQKRVRRDCVLDFSSPRHGRVIGGKLFERSRVVGLKVSNPKLLWGSRTWMGSDWRIRGRHARSPAHASTEDDLVRGMASRMSSASTREFTDWRLEFFSPLLVEARCPLWWLTPEPHHCSYL